VRPGSETRQAAVLAALYIIVGALWIFFSDRELEALISDAAMLGRAQTWKGWFFILATAALFFVLTRNALRIRARLMGREQASEKRSRDFMKMIPFGIFHMDAGGVVTCVNSMAATLADRAPGELLGSNWRTVLHDEDRDRVVAELGDAIKRNSAFRMECRLKRQDGAPIWVVAEGRPQTDEQGRFTGYIGTVMDITEARVAGQKLQASEMLYREMFESNPNIMCVFDADSLLFLEVNAAMVAHYGWSREEFLAMSVKDIRPVEEIPSLLEKLHDAGPGLDQARVSRHKKKNGDVIEVEVRSHTLNLAGHHGRLTLIRDVTEQRRTETALARERAALQETSARLNHLLTTSPIILYATRMHRDAISPVWVSESITRILGYSQEEALDPTWWIRHMHADDRQRIVAGIPEMISSRVLINEYRFARANGEIAWIRDEARVQSCGADGTLEIVGAWSDITRQRLAEERQRLDAAAFESTRDGVMIADLEARILSVNRAFLETTGYSEAELLGQSPRILQSGRHGRDFFQGMWFALSNAGLWRGEIWNRRKSGEIFPAWLTISAVHNDRGEPTHYVAIYTDVSKLKESEEKLKYLAHFDPLTDLPNRLLVQSRLEHAIDQAQRRGDHISLLFIDLDDFKQVNDSLGHVVGDDLLVQVAGRLRTRVRSEDTLARLGGDEFVVLLEKLEQPEDAATVAQALLTALAAPFQLPGGRDIYVRGSIGISVFPDDGTTPAELLRAADTAMYQAKAGGGDRFLFFTSRMGAEVMAGMELEAALRRALDLKELSLHFQPRVDLRDGGMQGAEALLRWHRSGVGLVPPGDFIPIAEKSGLIVPMGNWVIDAACRQYRSWVDQGLPPMQIGVNVSARQFRGAELGKTISVALLQYDMPADMLVLELTESMLMERVDEAVEVLKQLKGIGVQLSLDDFGTGFSSLSYLTRFPIDTLKIDRSFICNVETDASAKTIVNLIINLAHSLGQKVVAEGVETAGQCHYLGRQGCDEMQGYFFSRPLPAEQFTELLQAGKRLAPGDRATD
jgi:diguanylate cyclase (GGDEF)-like protein/PAS domain S-box-containing protein